MAFGAEPSRFARVLRDRRLRYLLAGSSVFVVNVLAFEGFRALLPDALWGRNVANVAATEISYLYGYVVHAMFTWRADSPSWRGLVKFHVVSGFGFVLRTLAFAVLDWWGAFPALICLMLSIGIQLATNFLGYERWVFAPRRHNR